MKGLWELTNALLDGTISDHLYASLSLDWRFALRNSHPKNQIASIISGIGKAADFKFCTHS